MATWLYGAHRWPGAAVLAELGRRPAGARRLYLSVEDRTRAEIAYTLVPSRLGPSRGSRTLGVTVGEVTRCGASVG